MMQTEEKCVKKCKNCWWCDETDMFCYMKDRVNYVKEDECCKNFDDRLKHSHTLKEWLIQDPNFFVYPWKF